MRIIKAGVVALLVSGAVLLAGAPASWATTTPPADAGATGSSSAADGSAAAGSAMSGSESAGTSAAPSARVVTAAAAAANPPASLISLSPGLNGFDNIAADTQTQLSCLSRAGYTFDVIDALGTGWDTEYRSAAALGMSIVLFQGFYKPFWSDPAQGTARGQLMVTNAQSVGYPRGAQVYLNLEDNLSDGTNPTTRTGIIQWAQNWAAAVRAAGYVPGVYVGVPQILTSADLTSSLSSFGAFWRSASGSAPQTSRGYVMRQPSISVNTCGTIIDTDTSGSDAGGGTIVGAGFPRAATIPTVSGAVGPLTPARILDTRFPTTPNDAPLQPYTTKAVQITGQGGVPTTGVSAVVINLTAVEPTATGDLVAWPTGKPQPLASNLNFNPGQVVPNLVIVPVGPDGKIQIYNHATGITNIIIDVAGYYLAGTPTAPGTLGALTPARILDTRFPTTPNDAPLQPYTTKAVQITGQGGVPTTGVSAVVINLTAVEPTATGDLVAWPTGKPQPLASNLNFNPGQVVPNLVIVPVGPDGKIQIYNHATGVTNIIIDVAGYYLAGTPTAPGTLGALTPARILDTRFPTTPNDAPLQPYTTKAVQITGQGGVPTTGVSAVVINLTAVQPTATGDLVAWPTGKPQPLASNLNFNPGQVVPNLVIVPVGPDGKIQIYNHATGVTNIIVDVVGYIAG